MHIQTHALLGWCVGNLCPIAARQRFCCMLAATLPDLDGLGIFFGQEAYWDYHHVLGHNLLYGLLLSGVLTVISKGRLGVFTIYLALFHSHLIMDYFGSGPDWPILYWWPFSRAAIVNPHAWPLFSWQNISAFAILLAWTVVIAIRQPRTPLEAVMPRLDAKIVVGLRHRLRLPTEIRLRRLLRLPTRIRGFEVVTQPASGYNHTHESTPAK